MSANLSGFNKEIVDAILSQGILVSWPYLVLFLLVSFVGGFAGTFLRSYSAKRGELYATKADFDVVLAQLRASTRAAEETRAEISASFGDAAAAKALLRSKIEEFFLQLIELDRWQVQLRSAAFRAQTHDHAGSSGAHIEMLMALYFPEIRTEVEALLEVCRDMEIWAGRHVIASLSASQESAPAPQVDMDEFGALINRFVAARIGAQRRIVSVYAERAGL